MTTYQRYDLGELRTSVRTPEGYVLAEGFAARPGVLEYRQADGTIRRELVLPEELHRADSLETLGRKPVTLEHPTTDAGESVFVAPENVQAFGVGDVAEEVEVERLNGFVKIRMAVRRQDAIQAIDQGIRELSAGYTVDLDTTPGTHPVYGRYDAIQRNRQYNHVAIVRMGRAGAGVALRADSAVQVTPFQQQTTQARREKTMADEVKDAVNEALARRDADEKAKKLADENEELKKQVDALKAKVDVLTKRDEEKDEEKGDEDEDEEKKDKKKDKKTDAADRMAWFRARTDAMNVAHLAGVEISEQMDVIDIKRAVVKGHLGDGVRADAGDAYFDAAYDLIKGQLARQSHQQAYSGITQAIAPPTQPNARQDAQMSPEEAYLANLGRSFRR